jgi:ATP-dependent 26S proteasome regulatory subunit
MTTNHIDLLEPALYRSGRVDVCLEFKKCNLYQIECIFNRIIKHPIDKDILNAIPEDVYTPADIIF